jgi:hypothetical protein
MLPLIVFAGALATVWYLEYWPFNRSYTYLPKHGEKRQQQAGQASATKPRP